MSPDDGSDASSADGGSGSETRSFVWGSSLGDGGDESGTRTTNGDERTASDADTAAGGAETTTGSAREPATQGARDPAARSSSSPETLDPDRYLFAGETVVERVDVRRGWVVVTTHRLLVFDPESSGKRFEAVDRPNVLGVELTDGGSRRFRSYGVRSAVYAVALFVSWFVARSLGLRSLFSTRPDVGGTPGVGDVVSVLSLVGAAVGFLVDLLFVVGVFVGLVALVLTALFLRGRQPTFVVERAGEDDLNLQVSSVAVGRRTVDGIERALADELAVGRATE